MSNQEEKHKKVDIVNTSPVELNPITEPLWTAEDVAKYLRLEPETVRAMAREGKIPALKVGRVWRFRLADVKEYLLSGRNQ